MASLNYFIRTSQKKAETVTIRARLRNGRSGDFYATTEYVIPASVWDARKGMIKQSAKFDDTFTADTAQNIINGLEEIEKVVIASLNNAVGTDMPKDWLQRVVDSFYQKKVDEKRCEYERLHPVMDGQAVTLNNFITKYIEDAESGKRLTRDRKERFAFGTIKSLRGFQVQFEEYQQKRGRVLDFEHITMDFYYDFTQYFSIEKKYSVNTVGRMVRILKTIMLAARDLNLHKNTEVLNRSFKADSVDVDSVYLTEERLNVLFEIGSALSVPVDEDTKRVLAKWKLDNIMEKTRKAWSAALDVFLVGCWTGQRFSDYSRISSNMIIVENGRKFIEVFQKKTKKTIYVPLIPQVEAILSRNKGVLPKVFEQKLNEYVKLICEQAGFTEIVKVEERKGALTAKKSYRFCDLVKSHTARRSMATNMQKSGAPLLVIMTITGHSSEALLRKYLKLDGLEKAKMAAECDYFSKMRAI